MRRGLRSETVDVQRVQNQLGISQLLLKDVEIIDGDTTPILRNSSALKQSFCYFTSKKQSNEVEIKNNKEQNSNLKRLSIRDLLKYAETPKCIEKTKKDDGIISEHIKNVITLHNEKYKYYTNDINNSHNQINQPQKKKEQTPLLQGILTQKASNIDYLTYQTYVPESYWAGMNKKSTGKNTTPITPYIFKQNNNKTNNDSQNSRPISRSSRISSSCSTSRKNSKSRSDLQKNDSELYIGAEQIQPNILFAKEQQQLLQKSNDNQVKKSPLNSNFVDEELKSISQTQKRASLSLINKEKRIQSARAHQPKAQQNELQMSYNKMQNSMIQQENSIKQESMDFQLNKEQQTGFDQPFSININENVSFPIDEEIFNSRQFFMRGNTLKNNWMSKLQQQINTKRIKDEQEQQKYQKQQQQQILEGKPSTPQQQALFCLTNEFIIKQNQVYQFSSTNTSQENYFKNNSKKQIKNNGNISQRSSRRKKSGDENHLSITQFNFQDNLKKIDNHQQSKSKQTAPHSTPRNRNYEQKSPLTLNNWRR